LNELGAVIQWPNPPELNLTLEEYKEEVRSGKLWLAFNGFVYDVKEFSKIHPGGEALILSMIGKDPEIIVKTMLLKHTHTKAARNFMETISVARLV